MCEVEVVVKDIDGASFHRGVMIDVDEQRGALVQLLAHSEQRWLPRAAMRLKRDTEPPKGWSPQVGELVEVQVIEAEDDEPFYRLAEIRREREGLFFVRFGGPRGTRHDSVDRRRIRPSFGLQPAVGDYDKREIPMPVGDDIQLDFEAICDKSGALAMHEYLPTPVNMNCFSVFASLPLCLALCAWLCAPLSRCGSLCEPRCYIYNPRSRYPERPSVVALGTTKAVELAQMLVELSIQKHAERQRLRQAAAELKASQPKFACAYHVEFTVPLHMIGLVIGPKGDQIAKTKRECRGVVDVEVSKTTGVVAIHGDDEGGVGAARAMLEFQEDGVHMQPPQAASSFAGRLVFR